MVASSGRREVYRILFKDNVLIQSQPTFLMYRIFLIQCNGHSFKST